MDEKRLSEIKARAEKGVPGLTACAYESGLVSVEFADEDGDSFTVCEMQDAGDLDDAELFAHAREDVLALVAEVERMQAALVAVEWDGDGECPWCGADSWEDHRPTCQRQAALGIT